MAETDYIALLNQGVERWNRWRDTNPHIKPDLSQSYLFEAKLKGANLSHVNLSRACLIGANLEGANLQGATLVGAYMSGTQLQSADLSEADLSQTSLTGANLSGAIAQGTNFTAADLTGARLQQWQIDAKTCLQDAIGLVAQDLGSEGLQASGMAIQATGSDRAVGTATLTPIMAIAPPHRPLTPLAPQSGQPQKRLILGLGSLAIVGLLGVALMQIRPQTTVQTSQAADGPLSLPTLPCNEAPPPPEPDSYPTHEYQNGTRYYGEFVNGMPANGRGIMVFDGGDRYIGDFRNGRRNGCGTFVFANGRIYTGQFKNDQFAGLGEWKFENGDRYVGEFADNKCSGQGTFIQADGSFKSGTWQDGNLINDTASCNRGIAYEPTATTP